MVELRNNIVLLLGPTASGKTATAMALYDALGGEAAAQLISVDSAMIYRGMNIGTAKPSAAELQRYPHALVDIRDPADPYTVHDFVSDADVLVRDALEANRVPILVGGTMLYAKRFVEGIAEVPETDPQARAEIEQLYEREGAQFAHEQLVQKDPAAAKQIDPNNRQRVVRALEVVTTTGVPISDYWTRMPGRQVAERHGVGVKQFALVPGDRSQLHETIQKRFQAMLAAGFVDEVRGLYAEHPRLHLDLPAMRAVGYRQAWLYLAGDLSYEQFVADAVTATRRLAKRQLTWLRTWQDMVTLETVSAQEEVENRVSQILKTP